MNQVYIITDSSACIPEDVASRLNISLVPVLVTLGTRTYADGVNLTIDQFYERAETEHPQTSGPTIGHFLDAYNEVPGDAAGILCITLPSNVSVTYASARTAAQTYSEKHPDMPIEVVDLPIALGATGLVVMDIAELAQKGAGLAELRAKLDEIVPTAGIYIALDTVRYLIRGGRLGRLAGWVATKLSIRPVLQVVMGEVRPVARARSMRKAMDILMELVLTHLREGTRPKLMVLHAVAPERAAALRKRLEALFEPVFTIVQTVTPVLGTHSGPGAVGVAFLAEPEEGWQEA